MGAPRHVVCGHVVRGTAAARSEQREQALASRNGRFAP